MVYGVVRDHGGHVNVYSEVGVGSTFKIYLPASSRPAVSEYPISEAPPRGDELILVVDDEPSIRSLARDMLEAHGYSVLLAEDGAQAINVYKQHNGDIKLVVLDMIMPKMGGHETFLELKKLNDDVKVLLSTGYSQDGKAQDIMESGVMGFVQKPYRVSTLLSKVRTVLDTQSFS
jgi:CheY-like chemotaxis protein